MADNQTPFGGAQDVLADISTGHGRLGENLALSQLSTLPQLPSDHVEDNKLQQLHYAMHLGSATLNFTPATGTLRNLESPANRFDDRNKRKIYVNKEVLSRLVSVAEELNKAQASIEIRKLIKREQKKLTAEGSWQPGDGDGEDEPQPDPRVMSEIMAGMEVEDDVMSPDSFPSPATRGYRPTKRMPSMYRAAQVRYPAALSSVAPKDRWGYFRAMQRLMPAANGVRPGHIAFGGTAPSTPAAGQQRQRRVVVSTATAKAAKAIIKEADGQGSDPSLAEDAAIGIAAAMGGSPGGEGGDARLVVKDMGSTVAAVMAANEVREARRLAARQVAEDEGLPSESWYDIMQKRKKMVYFKKLLDEMSGRMDLLRMHRSARIIQKAWRAHRRKRTRNASEEIALLQKELAHRKAMEVALRSAAEAAIREQQERAKKRAQRLAQRLAALGFPTGQAAAPEPQPRSDPQPRASPKGNSTFGRAASSKGGSWMESLRASTRSSALSHSTSRLCSRAPSQRVMRASRMSGEGPAGEGDQANQPVYGQQQNHLWLKIQALIGTEWDVDEESSSSSEDDDSEEEEEEEDSDGEDGDEDEHARRLRLRRERNVARRERKAAADAEAAAAEEGSPQKKKKKKKRGSETAVAEAAVKGLLQAAEGDKPMFPLSKATMLARVVKQAMRAAKAQHHADDKKPRKPKKRRPRRVDPSTSLRMLSAAAAAMHMTVESYVAMRNRKLGLTAVEPWQPPPHPIVVEADGQHLAIAEEELREMEEEARHELMEKAALKFVTSAVAAASAAASASPSRAPSSTLALVLSGSLPLPTPQGGAMPSGAAAAEGGAAGLESRTSSVLPEAAATWAGAAAVAAASADATTVPPTPPGLNALLTGSAEMTPEDAAAAFAAAAAPSLTIQEDEVWALVKEKLRARVAARAAAAVKSAGRGRPAASGPLFIGRDTDDGGNDEEGSAAEDETTEEEESEEEDKASRRKKKKKKAEKVKAPTPKSSGLDERDANGDGSGSSGRQRRQHASGSSSEYDTMSEDEVQHASPGVLQRIEQLKAKSARDLRGYYSSKILTKRAAAVAAAEVMRAERAAVRAMRKEALARMNRAQSPGPAWRPGGGGGAVPRRPIRMEDWSSDVAAATDRGGTLPRRRRALHANFVEGDVHTSHQRGGRVSGGGERHTPVDIVRLGPYNMSPGGPSLLYRETPQQALRAHAKQEKPSVRAAPWCKGTGLPNAVFTQYGWVAARPTSDGVGGEAGPGVTSALTLQLETLPEPNLLPALENFVKQLGIPRVSTSTAATSARTTLSPYSSLPPPQPPHPGGPPLVIHHFHAPTSPNSGGPSPSLPTPPQSTVVIPIGGPGTSPGRSRSLGGGLSVAPAHLIPHPPGHPPAAGRPTRAPVLRHSPTGTTGAATDDEQQQLQQLVAEGQQGEGGPHAPNALGGGRMAYLRARSLGSQMAQEGQGQASVRGGRGGSRSRPSVLNVSASLDGDSGPTSSGSVQWFDLGDGPTPPEGGGGVEGGSMRGSAGGAAHVASRSSRRQSGILGAAEGAERLAGGGDVGGDAGRVEMSSLQGSALQVAMAVLRSRSIKPGVARRVFPQGRACIADPSSDVRPLGDGTSTVPEDEPLSFPIMDTLDMSDSDSSSTTGGGHLHGRQGQDVDDEDVRGGAGGGGSSDSDAWTTASEAEQEQHEGEGKAGRGKRGKVRQGDGAAAATATAAGRAAEILGFNEWPRRGSSVGDPSVRERERSSQELEEPPGAAPAAYRTLDVRHMSLGLRERREGPQLRVSLRGEALAKESSEPGMGQRASTTAIRGGGKVAGGVRPAPPHLPVPVSTAWAGGGAHGLVVWGTDAVWGMDDQPLEDEEGVQQFDLLYDMTRCTIAPPPTPTGHRPDTNVVAITIRRSEAAKQREEELRIRSRRARILGAHGGHLGTAYERVQYRRRQARAMAAMAAAQSPAAALLLRKVATFRTSVAGTRVGHRTALSAAAAALISRVADRSRSGSGDGAAGPPALITSGGGFRRPKVRTSSGGGSGSSALQPLWRRHPPAHPQVVPGVGWQPNYEAGTATRIRPRRGGGAAMGFGHSYYWRQPVRLASIMRIRPAGVQERNGGAVSLSGGGAAAGPSPAALAEAAELAAAELAAVASELTPPPEVTEMANTAFKLLSELGSEIGRMEEELQALERRAEAEKRRGVGDGGSNVSQSMQPAASQSQVMPALSLQYRKSTPSLQQNQSQPQVLLTQHNPHMQPARIMVAQTPPPTSPQQPQYPQYPQQQPQLLYLPGQKHSQHAQYQQHLQQQYYQQQPPQQPQAGASWPTQPHPVASGPLNRSHYLTLHQQQQHFHYYHPQFQQSAIHRQPSRQGRLSHPQRAPATPLDPPDGIQGTSLFRIANLPYGGAAAVTAYSFLPNSTSMNSLAPPPPSPGGGPRKGGVYAAPPPSSPPLTASGGSRSRAYRPSSPPSSLCASAIPMSRTMLPDPNASVDLSPGPNMPAGMAPSGPSGSGSGSGSGSASSQQATGPSSISPSSGISGTVATSTGASAGPVTAIIVPDGLASEFHNSQDVFEPQPSSSPVTSPLSHRRPSVSGGGSGGSLARRLSLGASRIALVPTPLGGAGGGPLPAASPAGGIGSRRSSLTGMAGGAAVGSAATALYLFGGDAAMEESGEGGAPAGAMSTGTGSRAHAQSTFRAISPPGPLLPSIAVSSNGSGGGGGGGGGTPGGGGGGGSNSGTVPHAGIRPNSEGLTPQGPHTVSGSTAAGVRHGATGSPATGTPAARLTQRQTSASKDAVPSVSPSSSASSPNYTFIAPASGLPDIPQVSPRASTATAAQAIRTSLSYSSGSGSGANRLPVSSFGPPSPSPSTMPIATNQRAPPASPPMSPLRSYPKMELGLGPNGSPGRLRRSSNGPAVHYYTVSGNSQPTGYDTYDPTGMALGSGGVGGGGVSVDSLLLNMSLFGPVGSERVSYTSLPHRGAPQQGARRSRASEIAPAAAAAVAAPGTPATLASTDFGNPTATGSITGTGAGGGASGGGGGSASSRFGRFRRLSVGALPGSAGSAAPTGLGI